MAIEMKKIKVKMNKPIYLGISMLNLSKAPMCEFWYDYIKWKYQDKANMDTDSFAIPIKTEAFQKDIANDVEKWFDTSNYDQNDKRPLSIGKSKRAIGLFKDELGGRIVKEFVWLRAKTYAYLMDDDREHKKAKGTKKGAIKRRLLFKNYKDCQFSNEIIIKSQQRFKSNYHNVYNEQISKIPLSSNHGKRLQTLDKTTTYPYGANAFMWKWDAK